MADTIFRFTYESPSPDEEIPRSRLYHLQPIGLGTPYTESFTSYLTRLAQLYCIAPRILVLQEIFPLLKISSKLKPDNRMTWLRGSTRLNGMTALVQDWVQAVEQLTFCHDLKFLTMLTWCNVINPWGIVRQTRAWCPICYDEWLHAGNKIYDPLIWTIRAIDECPRHKCNLLSLCPHCQKSLPLLDSGSKPGLCPKCDHFLGISTSLKSGERGKERQEWCDWVGNAVGELIAFAPRIGNPPTREVLTSGITALMEQAMNGSVEALARSLGVRGIQLRGWQKGLHLFQFNIFLQLCRYIKISPLNFLTQRLNIAEFNTPVRNMIGNLNFVCDQELQQSLEAILSKAESPFPSMRDVARELKYPVQVLEYKFPQLCQDISRKHQKQLDPIYQKNFLERVLIDKDLKRYCLNEIARLMGCRVTLIKYRFPDLCRQIVKNCEKKVNLENMQKALNEIKASTQNPPPSLKEALANLGYAHTTAYHYFPDLCHAIAKKHQEWLVTQRAEPLTDRRKKRRKPDLVYLQKYLDDILMRPELPPSLSQIARNVGYYVGILTYHFPEQCKAIKERRRDLKGIDEQRHVLESIANAKQISMSVNEIARRLGCSSKVLYNRFPELCRIITERRWKLVSGEDIYLALEAVLIEEPPASLVAVARRLGCPVQNLEYYFPDLCKAIAGRHRLAADRDGKQKALEAFLNSEEVVSFQEAARRLGVKNVSSFRKQFPELSLLISKRYKDYRRKNREVRVQKLCDEVRQAALLLHSQGVRPDKAQVGAITGKPITFMIPEVREAFGRVMEELGYK